MALGEAANFAAYAFAPGESESAPTFLLRPRVLNPLSSRAAILVTPLGALSIIFSAVGAHYLLSERLNVFGILGCVQCIVGSVVIVLHAPAERQPDSVQDVFSLAMQPGKAWNDAAAGRAMHLQPAHVPHRVPALYAARVGPCFVPGIPSRSPLWHHQHPCVPGHLLRDGVLLRRELQGTRFVSSTSS